MNVIIGEIITDFSIYVDDNGLSSDISMYEQVFSGSLLEMADLLQERNKSFELITKLGGDNLKESCLSVIKGIYNKKTDYLLSSTLYSLISINKELRLKGTAPASINADELQNVLCQLKPNTVLLSGVLLSINPASSAIVDVVTFLDSKPKVFIDLSSTPSYYSSIELLKRAVDTLSSSLDTYVVGDIVSSDKAKRIEKSHLCDYLD